MFLLQVLLFLQPFLSRMNAEVYPRKYDTNMGKVKASQGCVSHGCCTSDLHQPGKSYSNVKLVHHTRISKSVKETLLKKIGKPYLRFIGKICTECINEIKYDTNDHSGTQRSVQSSSPENPEESMSWDSVESENNTSHTETSVLSKNSGEDTQPGDTVYLEVDENSIEDVNSGKDLNSVVGMTSGQNGESRLSTKSGELVNLGVGLESSQDLNPREGVKPGQAVNLGLGVNTQDGVNVSSNTDKVYVISVPNLKDDIRAMPAELRAMLAFELGALERQNVKADARALTKGKSRQITSLTELCSEVFLTDRNSTVVNFLGGLHYGETQQRSPSGTLPFPITTTADIYKIAKVTESCMGLTTPVSVLPFHFRELVLLYSLTRSRMALTLLSSTAPHGSYTTVRSWLENLGSTHSEILPQYEGDVLSVFDNNQVMQRRWRITTSNTATCSVVTMIIFIDVEPKGQLQFQEELKPIHWMWANLTEEDIKDIKLGHKNPVSKSVKYELHFHPWLTDIIHQVATEQSLKDGKHADHVDDHITAKQHSKVFKTCPGCGHTEVQKRARICRACNQKISSLRLKKGESLETNSIKKRKSQEGDIRVLINKKDDSTYGLSYQKAATTATPYDHLKETHPSVPPKVTIGEPLFVNPCSYDSVAKVFRAIGEQAGIKRYGGEREWLTIVCDGLPYVMGYKLVENMYICCECEEIVYGPTECVHHQQEHNGTCSLIKEFDWVLLQPGPGHIEMNMIKTFVKFAWVPFWEEMVELFNFRSENAKRSAQNVSDHHKGMTLARIARESFGKELVLPYVRAELMKDHADISVAGYLKYVMQNVKSANYAFISNLVFEILDAIFCYRAGVRSGKTEMMDAGRAVFSQMWCARSHPLYRQLDTYDSLMYASMPPLVKDFVNKTKSFNLSGVPFSGEGADFKLEEVNRNIQHWIPPSPVDKDWRNACANFTPLSDLRRSALNEMGTKDPKERSSNPANDISEQVLAFRAVIREKEYVLNPDKIDTLTSLNHEPLDEDLVNFHNAAQQKKACFVQSFIEHAQCENPTQSSVPFDEAPVFVTKEERLAYNDIRNKTISECVILIKKKISEIEDPEMRQNFNLAFDEEIVLKKGKRPVKQDYLDFYYLAEEYESYMCSGEANTEGEDV